MRRLIMFVMIIAVALYLSPVLFAAEHPGTSVHEHPGEHPGKGVEHPGEHEELAMADVKDAILAYINKDIELKGGYFLIYDATDKLVRQLNFVRVHEDKLSYVKTDDAYFACSDFVSAQADATKVDIDFWMKKDEHTGGLSVYKITIHKINGKPRYTYVDDKIAPVAE